MKTIFTLIILTVIINSSYSATTYSVTTNTTWTTGGYPTSCVTCTFNISSGVTLTIDKDITCQNCTFNGGNIAMASHNLGLQTSGGNTTFSGTNFSLTGTSKITGSAPVYISNSVFTFRNTSNFNPQQLLNITGSILNFYDATNITATGGPVNLIGSSLLQVGNGVSTSTAYAFFNGATLNIYDYSSLVLGNNNNYYFNWSNYNYITTFPSGTSKSYATSPNSLNCNGSNPHACATPYLYGTASLSAIGFSSGSILPIKLLDFTASVLSDHTAQISWTTEQESNSKSFIIERSLNGSDWKAVGSVDAKGNTSTPTNYSYNDASGLSTINYYRLKMIDANGKYEYSAVQTIRTNLVKGISFYPNPAHDFVNVSLVSSTNNSVTVRLINQSGQVLQERTVNGSNATTVTMPVQKYATGMYILSVSGSDGTTQSSKLVISRQ